MKRIGVGDPAPDLVMAAHTGEPISLADYRGQRPVVVFFYPKDGTPVCTKEVCGFRDAYADFAVTGALVIGVSSDTASRHQAFADKHALPFFLVSDHDGDVRRAFGVARILGVIPGRVTFVIDRQGIVRHVVSSQFSADRHVEEALRAVRESS